MVLERLEPRTLLSSGQLDQAFGYQGNLAIGGAPQDIAFYPDGRFLASQAYSIIRYTADGQRDNSFGSLGSIAIPGADVNTFGGDVAIDPSGKIVAAIEPASGGGQLLRYNADGSPDTTFGTNGATAPIMINAGGQQVPLQVEFNSNFHDLAVFPDGRILVAGIVTVPNAGHYTGMAMFLPDGMLDPSFNGNGTLYVPPDSGDAFKPNFVLNLAISNNEILFCTLDETSSRMRLYEFNPDGTRNTAFGSNSEITLSDQTQAYSASAMAIQNDGKIVLAYQSALSTYAAGSDVLLRGIL